MTFFIVLLILLIKSGLLRHATRPGSVPRQVGNIVRDPAGRSLFAPTVPALRVPPPQGCVCPGETAEGSFSGAQSVAWPGPGLLISAAE